jgi:hypothetical protein
VARRKTDKLILVAGLALVVACGETTNARVMRPGDTAPSLESFSDPSQIVVVWVSRPEDYLLCKSPAFAMRQVQRRYGEKVRVVAVSLDDADGGLALRFFRAERVRAHVLRMPHREWKRMTGNTQVPLLYVTRNHRIVRSWTSFTDVFDTVAGTLPPLAGTVDSLFQAADAHQPAPT